VSLTRSNKQHPPPAWNLEQASGKTFFLFRFERT